MDIKDLERRFESNSSVQVQNNCEYVRQLCKQLARELNESVPDGREKSLAVTHLEEVMMWSNKGIANNA